MADSSVLGGRTDAPEETDAPEKVDASADQIRSRGPILASVVEWSSRVLLTLALGVGIFGVTRVWWSAVPMWKDEASIANNLRRSFLQLTGHLTYDQVAPVGWLWLEKLLLEVVGPDDRVLRFLPYLGALTVLCLGAFIARQAIGRFAAVAVALMLAFAPSLLVYAGETKQYAWEAAIALALLVLGAWAHRAIRWQGWAAVPRSWRAVLWVAATGVAVFVSFSAILVTAAVTAALLCLHAARRAWADLGWQAGLSVPAGLTAAFLVYRRHRYSFYPGQTDYFRGGTAPEGAGPREMLDWLPFMWSKFIDAPMGWRLGWLVLLLMVAGLVALWWRSRVWAVMLLMVFVCGVGGGAVRGFPVVSRPAIYLIAPTILLVVAAVDGLVRVSAGLIQRGQATPWFRLPATVAAALAVAAAVGVGMVAAPGAETAAKEIAHPLGKDALREGLRDISGKVQPGDVVLVYYFGNAVTKWYRPYLDLGPAVHHVRLCRPTTPVEKQLAFYEKLAGAKRVFYVEGQLNATTPKDHFELALQLFDSIGTVVEQHDGRGDRIGPHSWALIELEPFQPTLRPMTGDEPCLESY